MQPFVSFLRTDARVTPLGIDNPTPEFSWRVEGGAPQVAFELQFSETDDFAEIYWSSDRTLSATQFGVRYAGPPLTSCRRYFWRVRVWTKQGVSDWGDCAWFEMGILDNANWKARWITGATPKDPGDFGCVYLRGSYTSAGSIVSARAYVSALGWYRLVVNERDVTGDALVPRWTPFDHIIEYQVYDITDALRTGENLFTLAIGDGRFRGRLGAHEHQAVYGRELAGLAQIEVIYRDGTKETFVTDATWSAGKGRIVQSDPKHGEVADFRLAAAGVETSYAPARQLLSPDRTLVAEEVERVQVVGKLTPQRIWRTSSGKLLVDFGQNFAGVVRVRLEAPAGREITITLSEVLRPDGELDLGHLMPREHEPAPPQRDVFFTESGSHWYAPWFTVHGFRYAEIDGLDTDLETNAVEGLVYSTNLVRTGSFECSNEWLNRLYANVTWSMRSNFGDTPSDCPTRERSGWTGDIQIFSSTAALISDVQAYLRRYLRNLALEQFSNGAIPPVIPMEASTFSGGPRPLIEFAANSVGWGDAAIVLPHVLYREYGDRTVLERQYESMKAWVEHLAALARGPATDGVPENTLPSGLGALAALGRSQLRRSRADLPDDVAQYIVEQGFHWGEWLRPGDSFADALGESIRSIPSALATAYFAYSATTLADVARILDRQADAERYTELSSHVRSVWRLAFVKDGGARIGDDRQDDYVRALAFDLLEPDDRSKALSRLVELIELAGGHLGTGFLSTPMLLPTLARFGRADLSYDLLLQETNPSWLNQVKAGATTIWETWDGHDADGYARLSHNHYAFGAVAAWLVNGIAGLSAAEPGYRRINVKPIVDGRLTHASTRIATPFGDASSAWQIKEGRVLLDVTIPNGTTAEVCLGDGSTSVMGCGHRSFSWDLP